MLDFISENQRLLISYCAEITSGDMDKAMELFQYTCLELSRKQNITYKKAYFFKTAHQIYSDPRRYRNRMSLPQASLTYNTDLDYETPEEQTNERDLQHQAIINVIESCRDCEEIIIFEKYAASGSYRKTVKATGKPINTVINRVNAVKKRIRNEYNRLNSLLDLSDGGVESLR